MTAQIKQAETASNEYVLDPLGDIVTSAQNAGKQEGVVLKAAMIIASYMREGVNNVFNRDEIKLFATGKTEKGWLKAFCMDHIRAKKGKCNRVVVPSFAELMVTLKDRDASKEAKADALRMTNNIYALTSDILKLAAWISELPIEKVSFFEKRNLLQVTNDEGETLALSARKAKAMARKALGLGVKQTPRAKQATDLANVSPEDIMAKAWDVINKRDTIKDFTPDEVDAVNDLFIESAYKIGLKQAIEILQAELKQAA